MLPATFVHNWNNYLWIIVGNPQLIALILLSPRHPWVNWQRNPRSHVIVLKHFDKYDDSLYSQEIIVFFKVSNHIHCKFRGLPFFCMSFSPQRRRLTISNDKFGW